MEGGKPRIIQDGAIVWSKLPTPRNGTFILASVAGWIGQAPVLDKLLLPDSPREIERGYIGD